MWVALAVALLTPIAWGIFWATQPVSDHIPVFLQAAFTPEQWKFGPLAWFPAALALATYLAWKAGWTK